MKNSKIVVLNGLERGGTDIVWNILQTHPQLCSPELETGEILLNEVFRWAPTKIIRRILNYQHIIKSPLLIKSPLGFFLCNLIDTVLFNRKMENFGHPQNGYKYDGIPYSRDEVEKAALCLKSVNREIYLTDFFKNFYTKSFFIGLIRNGYALCNGWIRRGQTADEVGEIYKIIGQQMIEYQRRYENFILLKFEDVLKDPFVMANKLFRFLELDPICLEKLRLKSNKTISVKGEHETQFGEENKKYWLDSQQIGLILDSDINEKQIGLLKKKDLLAFEKHAKPVLEYFHYK